MWVSRFVSIISGRLKRRSGQLFEDTSGATSIEYSIVATLISIAIIGGVVYFGSQLSNEWLYLSNVINPELDH